MKWLALVMVGLFLVGCSYTATESEFFQHKSLYKNWDHAKFSITGFRNPTPEDVNKSQEQGWWGVNVPEVPAE
jgi:hypothetical protein